MPNRPAMWISNLSSVFLLESDCRVPLLMKSLSPRKHVGDSTKNSGFPFSPWVSFYVFNSKMVHDDWMIWGTPILGNLHIYSMYYTCMYIYIYTYSNYIPMIHQWYWKTTGKQQTLGIKKCGLDLEILDPLDPLDPSGTHIQPMVFWNKNIPCEKYGTYGLYVLKRCFYRL